ncbi:AMP-binding protein [Streptomyces halobius]|uniref:AMP-binding protein n=1 Tax=Streptomyces halobius TaxID=2879846 RepID=UPI003872D794
MSRAGFGAAVSACAARLSAAGLRKGELVAVQLPNDVHFVILVLALIRLGAVPVLIRQVLREHEVGHVLSTMRPSALAVPVRQEGFDHLAMGRRLRAQHPAIHWLLVSDASGDAELGLGEWNVRDLCRPAAERPDTADCAAQERRRPCWRRAEVG